MPVKDTFCNFVVFNNPMGVINHHLSPFLQVLTASLINSFMNNKYSITIVNKLLKWLMFHSLWSTL